MAGGKVFKLPAVLTAVFCAFAACGAYTSKIALDQPDGIYETGETASCTVEIFKDGRPLAGEKVRLFVRWEAQKVKSEDRVADGRPMTISHTGDKPCYPSNVFAFYNAIPATTKKSIATDPRIGHFNTVLPPAAAAARLEELAKQPPENAR